MATLTTRALLLGVASIFEPANGYQLRRELLSWGVEDWAHIRPGSIYSMLATFTKQGLLERHDLREGERDVAVYTVTDAGKAELQTLLREAAVTVNAMDPSAFRVVLSLAPLMTRAELLDALRERERRWADASAALLERIAFVARGFAPPHVSHSLELELRMVETERAWLAEYIGTLESGALALDGDEFEWSPPENDAGWQMVRESQSYREQLGR